jgi:hypothetical protein
VIRQLANQVAAHGVKRIRGRVLVDATLFPGHSALKTGTAISPISINDNVLDLTIGRAVLLLTRPDQNRRPNVTRISRGVV